MKGAIFLQPDATRTGKVFCMGPRAVGLVFQYAN